MNSVTFNPFTYVIPVFTTLKSRLILSQQLCKRGGRGWFPLSNSLAESPLRSRHYDNQTSCRIYLKHNKSFIVKIIKLITTSHVSCPKNEECLWLKRLLTRSKIQRLVYNLDVKHETVSRSRQLENNNNDHVHLKKFTSQPCISYLVTFTLIIS